MLTQKEIEKCLKGIDPQLCVAFAARCSLRALPMLIQDQQNKPFDYWKKKDRSRYLLSILRAQQFTYSYPVFVRNKVISDVAIIVASKIFYDTADISYNDSAFVVMKATDVATIVVEDDIDVTFATQVAEVVIATTRIFRSELFERTILADIDMISQFHPQVSAFLYTPLWVKPFSQWLEQFENFNRAIMDLDEGFYIWVNWYKDRINGKELDDEQEQQWLELPEEILEQGAKTSNTYLAGLISAKEKNIELIPLNLIRTIFIGNGAVGKTSLIRRLHGEVVIEGNEKMTPGIDISQWTVPGSEIKARFWDFGGQVLLHSTHKFFLRNRCFYVLVVDAGNEDQRRGDNTSNTQAEYWLELIKVFGNNAPVMLVGNKADKNLIKLDINRLKEKYDNIILKNGRDYYPISCTNDEKEYHYYFETFKKRLSQQLVQMTKRLQVQFWPNEFVVMYMIKKYASENNYLSEEKFREICTQYNIGEQGMTREDFLEVLDNLGEITYFKNLSLAGAYILNPSWLTHGVYTIIVSKQLHKQKGVVSTEDIVEILTSEDLTDETGNSLRYPRDKCAYIINAMLAFQLCYQLLEMDVYVIPDGLSEKQPDLSPYFNKNTASTLTIEFEFEGFLPRNIMANLIVARHHEIKKNEKGVALQWKYGVVLYNQSHNCTARIQVDYHEHKLYLRLQGYNPREYLLVLKDLIESIVNKIKGLEVNKYIHLPTEALVDNSRFVSEDSGSEKAPYDRLIAEAYAKHKTTISDSGKVYDLTKVLGYFITDEYLQKELTKPKFNRPRQPTIEKEWYQQRWLTVLGIASICGLLLGLFSKNIWVGVLAFVVVEVLAVIFNKKRRFFRIAVGLLAFGFVKSLPIYNGTVSFINKHLGLELNLVFNTGDTSSHWISAVFIILLAAFLFYLDSKEK
jgi:GTPase SAR1 family protein